MTHLPRRAFAGLLVALSTTGGAARFVIPPAVDPAWATAVIVQTVKAGPILAATKG